MKKVLFISVALAAIICFAHPGYAWQNTNQGCTQCHTATALHGVSAHSNCAACHDGSPAKGNVLAAKCTACHGEVCPLIDKHANKSTCLACHTDCAPASTTTTTPDGTTTTTAPAGVIITIDPAEIEVDGTNDVTRDVKVSIEAEGLTEADLEGLEVSFSDACSQYITVNTVNYAISGNKVEGTVNITVAGDAPTSECKITATNTAGTIDVETTFTITSTVVPPEECQIKSISPSEVRIGLGILPRIVRFTLTFNIDIEALGITGEDLIISTPNAWVLEAEVSGDTITARVLLFGLRPGTYNVTVGECGSIPVIIKRF
jgi:hypothetical protein